jgi:hypothetical protein
VEIDAIARPTSTIDFRPAGLGSVRRGVYSITDSEMLLDYGEPGGGRPASLAGAARYRTQ